MRSPSPNKKDALDVVQARRLADLISTSVAHLESEGEDREAILTITSAATQLATLLRPPAQVILEIATGFTLSAALRLVVEAHVPEIIRALSIRPHNGAGAGVSVLDISALCGVSASKLERILRLLATHHIFAECPSLSPLNGVDSNGSGAHSNSNSFVRHPNTSLSPLSMSHTRPHLLTDEYTSYSSPPASHRSACFVGEGEMCARDVGGEEGRVGDLTGGARFVHTRLSEVLDSGVDLGLLDLDIDVLSVGKEKRVEMMYGKNDENRMETDVNVENEGEEERRKKRWARKYGAEAPGAGLAALVGILTDESMFHATALTEVLLGSLLTSGHTNLERERDSKDPDSKSKSKSNSNPDSDSEDSPLRTAFSLSRGLPRATMFEWLSAAGNAHRLHRFGCAMRGMGSLTPGDAILKGFDFASLPRGATVVDVGGGVGAASLPILRVYPHLKLVVQDTEEVVGVAPGFWEAQYPEAIREGRVRFKVQSFFDAQPSFPFDSNDKLDNGFDNGIENGKEGGGGAPDVFLLRMIMHNWPDAECLRILRRLREASRERTKLVLVDSILMAACRERRGGLTEPGAAKAEAELMKMKMKMMKEAPEPLLANWGAANGLAYRLDLIMLANHNACERTLPAFDALLARSGWAIREVYAASESWMPQIVAVPVPASGCAEEL